MKEFMSGIHPHRLADSATIKPRRVPVASEKPKDAAGLSPDAVTTHATADLPPLRYGISAPPARQVWAAAQFNVEDTNLFTVPRDIVAYYNGAPPSDVRLANPLPIGFDGMKRMMQVDLYDETFGVHFRKSPDLKRMWISLESTRSPDLMNPRYFGHICEALNEFLVDFGNEMTMNTNPAKSTVQRNGTVLVTAAYLHPDLSPPAKVYNWIFGSHEKPSSSKMSLQA